MIAEVKRYFQLIMVIYLEERYWQMIKCMIECPRVGRKGRLFYVDYEIFMSN